METLQLQADIQFCCANKWSKSEDKGETFTTVSDSRRAAQFITKAAPFTTESMRKSTQFDHQSSSSGRNQQGS
jgi:hypothetical protein